MPREQAWAKKMFRLLRHDKGMDIINKKISVKVIISMLSGKGFTLPDNFCGIPSHFRHY